MKVLFEHTVSHKMAIFFCSRKVVNDRMEYVKGVLVQRPERNLYLTLSLTFFTSKKTSHF